MRLMTSGDRYGTPRLALVLFAIAGVSAGAGIADLWTGLRQLRIMSLPGVAVPSAAPACLALAVVVGLVASRRQRATSGVPFVAALVACLVSAAVLVSVDWWSGMWFGYTSPSS
jgi:hypothetical protein